ncbi:hypothetical protein EVAR_30515_1 [Eumeta japonica]|uniref:Uncharacterized protein n=1 Tax=Eumeta variegata TaxID=151549 RepID=A0A4C1VXY6_EUMVA|nr:hypothetical protein EVAR_30515_1 [Eumeta japonica]
MHYEANAPKLLGMLVAVCGGTRGPTLRGIRWDISRMRQMHWMRSGASAAGVRFALPQRAVHELNERVVYELKSEYARLFSEIRMDGPGPAAPAPAGDRQPDNPYRFSDLSATLFSREKLPAPAPTPRPRAARLYAFNGNLSPNRISCGD